VIGSPPRGAAPPKPDDRPEPGRVPAAAPARTDANAAAGHRPTRRERLRQLAAFALAVLTVLHLLAALGFLLVLTTVPPDLDLQTGPRSSSVGPQTGPVPTADPALTSGLRVPALRATELDIPALGIRQDLLELGVDASTGALLPPAAPEAAGWFTGAAAPGERGPTVIAGHVDSRTGPGVFHALTDLTPGDRVRVGRSDGRTATYRVTDVLTVDKDRFPTEQVYGPTAGPELRLITCGGSFDRDTGHYLRNVVVSGVLVDPS
jgi:LPXTG-site transpeptidase (sortase) family protein